MIRGNESLTTVGQRLVTTEGKHRLESIANIEFDTDSNMLETIGGLQDTQVGSTIDVNAGGTITMNSPLIDLNP